MNKDISPLDWHNTKFLDYIPDHFVKVKFRHDESRETVLIWLQHNVTGRYAIAPISTMHEKTELGATPFPPASPGVARSFWHESLYIGFEEPAEATMYAMFYK